MARRRDSGSSLRRYKSTNRIDRESLPSTGGRHPEFRTSEETLPKRSSSLKRRHEQTSAEGNKAPEDAVEQVRNVDEDIVAPSRKRHRGEEWPLKNRLSPIIVGNSNNDKAFAQNKQSTSTLTQSKAPGRPSRFLEASLNDKPSSRPPDIFIGDEELMEQYHQSQDATLEKPNPSSEAGNGTNRTPNAFRFGRLSKAFANVFNPSMVWHGINGKWKEKDGDAQTQRYAAVLEQRKMEADKAYTELKRTGLTGARPPEGQDSDQNMSVPSNSDLGERQPQPFRDSAIDMDEGRSQDHFAQEFTAATGSGKVSLEIKSSQAAADVPKTSSRRVSSFDLHVSSLHKLKKAKSQHQVVSHKHSASTPGQCQNSAGGEYLRPEDASKSSHKLQARKDFAKQQKLSKRVSDLETKLELARWELEQSMHEVSPVPNMSISAARKPFQPGALPSLPSERALAPEKSSEHSNKKDLLEKVKENAESGDYNYTRSKQSVGGIISPSLQLNNELKHSIAIDHHPPGSNEMQPSVAPLSKTVFPHETGVMVAAAQASVHRRKISRLHSSDKTSEYDHAAPKTPYNSPANITSLVSPDNEHPSSRTLLNSRTSCQVLGRPGAVSPVRMRTASGKHKRGVSPPPPSLSSAKKPRVTSTRVDKNCNEDENKIVSSKASLSKPQSEDAKSTEQKWGTDGSVEGSVGTTNKPLPEIQKEDYQWDDDVF